jgi:hypothetical protein
MVSACEGALFFYRSPLQGIVAAVASRLDGAIVRAQRITGSVTRERCCAS